MQISIVEHGQDQGEILAFYEEDIGAKDDSFDGDELEQDVIRSKHHYSQIEGLQVSDSLLIGLQQQPVGRNSEVLNRLSFSLKSENAKLKA